MKNYHSTNDSNIAVVIRIHREEIEGLGFEIPEEWTLEEIASELEYAILNNGWLDIVKIVCENIDLPKTLDNDKEV